MGSVPGWGWDDAEPFGLPAAKLELGEALPEKPSAEPVGQAEEPAERPAERPTAAAQDAEQPELADGDDSAGQERQEMLLPNHSPAAAAAAGVAGAAEAGNLPTAAEAEAAPPAPEAEAVPADGAEGEREELANPEAAPSAGPAVGETSGKGAVPAKRGRGRPPKKDGG